MSLKINICFHCFAYQHFNWRLGQHAYKNNHKPVFRGIAERSLLNIDVCQKKGGMKSTIVSFRDWVARLTCDQWIPVSREFEPNKWPPLLT